MLDGVEYAGIGATHSNMCKFDSKNSPGYDLVAEALQRYASKEAVATIKTRWQEDKKTLQEFRLAEAREAVSSYCELYLPILFSDSVADIIANENDTAQTNTSPQLHSEQHLVTSEAHTPHGTLKALPARESASSVEWQFVGVDEKDTEMA